MKKAHTAQVLIDKAIGKIHPNKDKNSHNKNKNNEQPITIDNLIDTLIKLEETRDGVIKETQNDPTIPEKSGFLNWSAINKRYLIELHIKFHDEFVHQVVRSYFEYVQKGGKCS